MKLILASQSPRRRELIKKITENVDFLTTDVDETIDWEPDSPQEVALYLAKLKALAAYNALTEDQKKDAIVVGSDTIVTLNNRIYGKPENREEAYEMLSELSGNTHSVITGVCLVKDDQGQPVLEQFTDETRVRFRPLTEEEINAYIDSGDPFDKAGAYGIQNLPEGYIPEIEGDYYNVVGLPVERLREKLQNFS